MTTCVNCSVWLVKDGDNYCAFCGHKFFSLNVSIKPSRFQHEDLPPPASLVIENRSAGSDVTITEIVSSEPWAVPDLTKLPLPLTLKAGQKRIIDVNVETLEAEDEYAIARIEVVSTAGSEAVTLEVLPAPDMDVETGEYEIQLDGRNSEETFATISMDAGAVTVTEIVAEPDEWVTVEHQEGLIFPIDLDVRHRRSIRVRLILNEERLRQVSPMLPALHEGTLRIVCQEFERSEPFRAKCWKAPELTVWEHGHRSDVLLGRPSQIALTLQNKEPRDGAGGKGNAVVIIDSIRWETDGGAHVDWIQPVADLTFPIRIAGGVFHPVQFVVDTRMGAVAEGRHRLRCVFQTNTVQGQETARYDIHAKPIDIYDGVLAIDFGTSNTCCAVLHNSQNDHEMVPLDSTGGARRTTVPTVSYYLAEQADGSRLLRIGAYADQLPAEPKVVQSTVRSPKRQLGKTRDECEFDVRYFATQEYGRLSVLDVVADFLTHVKQAAEDKAQATFREFIITHPARFRTKQVKALREAVRVAFGDGCEIKTLQEPVAAALDFIVSGEATESGEYVLGVFDLGGGTTDLSLLMVTNTWTHNVLSIEVKVVASTGKWFGGEDLTDFIALRAVQRAQQVLPKMNDVLQPAALLIDEPSSSDQSMTLMARANQLRLFQWSDLVKPLLFEKGEGLTADDLPFRPDLFPDLTLHAYTPAGTVDVKFSFDTLKPDNDAVLAHLDAELRVICGMLKELVKNSGLTKLDRLLLSGKSTVIPLVGTVVQEEFPDAEIVRSREPKECVVRGACIQRKLDHSNDVLLNVVGGTTTVSRLGLEGNSEGQRVFKQWIAAGVPIPPEGLVEIRGHVFGNQPIELLENDGDEDWRSRLKELNPNIEVQGIYDLEDPPAQLQGGARKPGRLELRVTDDYTVSLTGHVEGVAEPLRYRPRPDKAVQ